jgi:hypothetical protein
MTRYYLHKHYISAAAVAAGSLFEPYFATLYDMMRRAMHLTDKNELILRARATECVGLAVQAIGGAARPFIPEAMEAALAGLSLDCAELKEFSYGFFSNIAEAIKADFAVYLSPVMGPIWASCESSDGITATSSSSNPLLGEIEADEYEDEDVSIRTSFLDEKASAAHAIGMLASTIGAAFLPYPIREIISLLALTEKHAYG